MGKSIRVNNKVFDSISRAAKFIQVQRSNLSAMLRNKKAITYKDLYIEKLDAPTKKTTPTHTKKSIPVIVDGKPYNSCTEAERILGLPSCSLSQTLRRGCKFYKNYKVEAVYPSELKTKRSIKRERKNAVKVECITTGVVYNNIMDASIAANADEWTMSKKMGVAGSFIDANGNEYRRLTPMRTKNVYKNTGKTVQNAGGSNKRKAPKGFVTVDESLIMAQKTGEPLFQVVDFPKPLEKAPVKEQKTEVPQIVKDAINDKIIKLLKDSNIYDEIIELLNYGGFSSIKVKKDND